MTAEKASMTTEELNIALLHEIVQLYGVRAQLAQHDPAGDPALASEMAVVCNVLLEQLTPRFRGEAGTVGLLVPSLVDDQSDSDELAPWVRKRITAEPLP